MPDGGEDERALSSRSPSPLLTEDEEVSTGWTQANISVGEVSPQQVKYVLLYCIIAAQQLAHTTQSAMCAYFVLFAFFICSHSTVFGVLLSTAANSTDNTEMVTSVVSTVRFGLYDTKIWL